MYCDIFPNTAEKKPTKWSHNFIFHFCVQTAAKCLVSIEAQVQICNFYCQDFALSCKCMLYRYRSGTVNSKSFVGKVLLRIKRKFELTYAL